MRNKKDVEYYMSLPYRMEIYPDVVEGGYNDFYFRHNSQCRP